MTTLKGMFWNSQGICDPAKHDFIQETVREQRLDFIALSETGRSNFATHFINRLAAGLVLHGTFYLLMVGQGGC